MKEIAAGSTYDLISSCAGKWRKIASYNITAGDDCPIGWMNATVSGVSFCQMEQAVILLYFLLMVLNTRTCVVELKDIKKDINSRGGSRIYKRGG